MTHYFRLFILTALCATGAAHAAGLDRPVDRSAPPALLVQAQTPSGGINLTMEHRHALKELLLKDSKVKREGAQFEEGAVVPANVQLHPIPDVVGQKVPQIKSHSFLLTSDALVLVGTQDRKVVEVVRD
jgi:hypothetical protein